MPRLPSHLSKSLPAVDLYRRLYVFEYRIDISDKQLRYFKDKFPYARVSLCHHRLLVLRFTRAHRFQTLYGLVYELQIPNVIQVKTKSQLNSFLELYQCPCSDDVCKWVHENTNKEV